MTANTIKIVDAINHTALSDKPAGNDSVTVPLKIDASALKQVMKAASEQAYKQANPAKMIQGSSTKMIELYERFDALKLIGAELSSKLLSDPLPASLQLDEITVSFRIVKDGKTSDKKTAVVKTVICVGDLANLLTTEIGSLIVMLEQEATAVESTAKATKETCTKARQAWEERNPTRSISLQSVDADGNPILPDDLSDLARTNSVASSILPAKVTLEEQGTVNESTPV